MIYKKKKNRTRIVEIKDGEFFETQSGEKLPIMQAPMIFGDMYKEFIAKNQELVEAEKARQEAIKKGEEPDMDSYLEISNTYLELFYEIVETVTNFQGYEVDREWINSNFSYEDMWFYVLSIQLKRPIYSVEDAANTKKK